MTFTFTHSYKRKSRYSFLVPEKIFKTRRSFYETMKLPNDHGLITYNKAPFPFSYIEYVTVIS